MLAHDPATRFAGSPAPLRAVHARRQHTGFEKAKSLPADVLILDLEDAVAPDAKAAARQHVLAAVRSGFGHREVVVRINGLRTRWAVTIWTR